MVEKGDKTKILKHCLQNNWWKKNFAPNIPSCYEHELVDFGNGKKRLAKSTVKHTQQTEIYLAKAYGKEIKLKGEYGFEEET